MYNFIEVQRFGDFDILQTECIMYNPNNKKNAQELRNEFCVLENIENPTMVNDRLIYEITEKFIDFLKSKGFSKIKTSSTYFCN